MPSNKLQYGGANTRQSTRKDSFNLMNGHHHNWNRSTWKHAYKFTIFRKRPTQFIQKVNRLSPKFNITNFRNFLCIRNNFNNRCNKPPSAWKEIWIMGKISVSVVHLLLQGWMVLSKNVRSYIFSNPRKILHIINNEPKICIFAGATHEAHTISPYSILFVNCCRIKLFRKISPFTCLHFIICVQGKAHCLHMAIIIIFFW